LHFTLFFSYDIFMDSDLNRHSRGTSVLLGLSGGVDSAAAAALLMSAGYKVTALTLRTWKDGETQSEPYERAARGAIAGD